MRPYLLLVIFAIATNTIFGSRYGVEVDDLSQEEILDLGDTSLSQNDVASAIKYYEQGVANINNEEDSLLTSLSLHTNLGTAHSASGDERKAIEMYRNAILLFSDQIEEIVEESMKKAASDIAAQAAFFLGMSQSELENYRKSADAYAFAASLDPYHWAALANLGSVLQDHLRESSEALAVYNKAHDILTQKEVEPTDPPEDPKYVISQLQYRIGLAITFAENQKCVMHDDPTKEVPCSEMAASAFNYAIELDPSNENAKHMLASVTADATMRRASNTYVTQLFEDYAEK
jgi:tetratricopeptide (TPR) repeat protein